MTMNERDGMLAMERIARERIAAGLCADCGRPGTRRSNPEFCKEDHYVRCPDISCDKHGCPNCDRIVTQSPMYYI